MLKELKTSVVRMPSSIAAKLKEPLLLTMAPCKKDILKTIY
jgi:hypothetical protein